MGILEVLGLGMDITQRIVTAIQNRKAHVEMGDINGKDAVTTTEAIRILLLLLGRVLDAIDKPASEIDIDDLFITETSEDLLKKMGGV